MAQIKPMAYWIISALLLVLPTTVLAQAGGYLQAQAQDMQARAYMAKGDLHSALPLMREHVEAHPDDRAARLDLVRYLIWSGDYAAAKEVLEADSGAEQSAEGQELLANLLAWGGRIDSALEVNAPLLQATPENFLANYNQAVALRQTTRPETALPYVETVKRLRPDSKDANDLERATQIWTDSFITLDYNRSGDSDDLDTFRPTLRADIAYNEAVRFTTELGHWDYRAPASGPFAPVTGGDSVSENYGLVGLRYAPSSQTELFGAAGYSSIDNDGEGLWRLGANYRANDDWRFRLWADHGRVAISPRSLSLGLTLDGVVAQARWTPDLRWTGDLLLRHDHYSDDNNRDAVDVAIRRAMLRQLGFMLDLGLAAQYISYDSDPGNGYYAPSDYRRFLVTANSYYSFGDDVGLAVQGGFGAQRDETFSSWRSAGDISAELVFGIFSPWELRLRSAYSNRVQNTGAYDAYYWGMALTHRF